MTAAPPTLDAMLSDLASLGMRTAHVVTRMMEIELQAAEAVASWLPEPGNAAASLGEAVASGQGVDAANAALAHAVPRVEVLARAFDRLSRSVRRSVGLLRRIEAGWPHARSDDQAAMIRRQVARGVGEAIRREADGEAAERLFDELAERLEDPVLEAETRAMPVEEVVRRLCRDLGLVAGLPVHPRSEPPDANTS
jgi:hypothetical protein